MNYDEVLFECEARMDEAIDTLEKRFTNVRAGRANASMLDGIMVSYYGAPTPLKQLANISVPEARQLSIKPFDKSILGEIEKAIFIDSLPSIFKMPKIEFELFINDLELEIRNFYIQQKKEGIRPP